MFDVKLLWFFWEFRHLYCTITHVILLYCNYLMCLLGLKG